MPPQAIVSSPDRELADATTSIELPELARLTLALAVDWRLVDLDDDRLTVGNITFVGMQQVRHLSDRSLPAQAPSARGWLGPHTGQACHVWVTLNPP